MVQSYFFKNIYTFKEFTEDEINKIIQIINQIQLKTGEKLFSENDESDALYIIINSSVMIKKGSMVLSILTQGECIGEITFLNKEKRTSTVTAIEDSEIIKIKYDDLYRLMEENSQIASKIYKSIAIILSKRLVEISNTIETRFQPLKFLC